MNLLCRFCPSGNSLLTQLLVGFSPAPHPFFSFALSAHTHLYITTGKDSTRDWMVLVCVTLWCPIVALGQVMTRLRLDWLARPLPPTEQRYSTCFIVTCIVALPWLVHMALMVTTVFTDERQHDQDGNGGDGNDNSNNHNSAADHNSFGITINGVTIHPYNPWHGPIIGLVGLLIAVWFSYILCQTRRVIRRRDDIREECCYCCVGWEDCCCACCCPTCAIYQMSRHTGDFSQQRAVCCHATGLVDRPIRQLPPLLV